MQKSISLLLRITQILLGTATLLASQGGCTHAYLSSLGGNTIQPFHRIYLTDLNTAWQSVLDALKHSRLDITNREGGFIQTRWTENSTDKALSESFGNADSYLKAQYRFRVFVAKGFFQGTPSIKVNVQKEQLIQRDVLEGWRPVETDGIEELTLLYRVGRLIQNRKKLAQLQEEKIKHDLKEVD